MSRGAAPPPSFLGTGWAFPPAFRPGGAELETVEGVEDVHQSLAILLATTPGERPMQESFGCNLDAQLFEELDHALVNRIGSLIYDAVLTHEPRIALDNVDVTPSPREQGVLLVSLSYRVLGTNSRFNMVFPFYLNESNQRGL